MSIGEKIRKYRKEAGISQGELGKRLGISQQQIAQYENGKRVPKIETINNIASALNVTMVELCAGNLNRYKDALIDYYSTNATVHIKSTWEQIKDNDEKRLELITEVLKTHNYKIESEDIHWLTITDHQGFSFMVNRNEFQEMVQRCDKDITYNIEKLLSESRDIGRRHPTD